MKLTNKKILTLSLTLVMIAVLAVSALAGNLVFTGFDKDNGTAQITVDGDVKMTETDLFGGFKNVMPGDTITEDITIKNASDYDYIRVYMKAVPHDESNKPKVDENIVIEEMNDFLSQLTLTVKNGSDEIYAGSPDKTDGLGENVFLGEIGKGDKVKLQAELVVPIELDNKYANRIGEVDWKFTVECFNASQLVVTKVWSDGNRLHSGIKVNLLRDGKVQETVELNRENNWTYTFDKLDTDYNWSVEEVDVPDGYKVSYRTVGNTITIYNEKNTVPIIPPGPVPDQPGRKDYTVEKVWVNNGYTGQPSSVTVQLLKNGEFYDVKKLSEENDWTCTWHQLSEKYLWTFVEIDIPEDYVVKYDVTGTKTTITNTYDGVIEDTRLTVEKQWVDDGNARPGYVYAELLCDGKSFDIQKLDDSNDWTYTWEHLDANCSWAVVESEVPDGYEATYEIVPITNGVKVIITNTEIDEVIPETPIAAAPVNIFVKKVWSGDNEKTRPTSVTVTLYNGSDAVETATLGEWNGWSCSWTDLAGDGNWKVLETNIPNGYTPSYAVDGENVVITNTATLIQTGQVKWPIPVLCGLGVIFVGIGFTMIARKKKETHNA